MCSHPSIHPCMFLVLSQKTPPLVSLNSGMCVLNVTARLSCSFSIISPCLSALRACNVYVFKHSHFVQILYYSQCKLKRGHPTFKETTILGGMQMYVNPFQVRPLAYPNNLCPTWTPGLMIFQLYKILWLLKEKNYLKVNLSL